jgi:hypothetical protein
MEEMMSGAIAMGFAVAGLFFLRFWRETRDRLFILFAFAFFIMALSRVYFRLADPTHLREERYWVRFAAFALILVAILDKNRSRRTQDSGRG